MRNVMADEDNMLVKVAQEIKRMREQWVHRLELIKWQSKLCKARYDALRAEGFEAAEALALCTKNPDL